MIVNNLQQQMKLHFQPKDLIAMAVPRPGHLIPSVPGVSVPSGQRLQGGFRNAPLRPGSGSDQGFKAKRLYDIFFSGCGLVLLAPLFAVIALLVRLADGGEVFYRQMRVGRGGREFVIYKFRTMVPAAEQAGPSVTKNGDRRITWIGRLLRKTKLDELPQLLNVLKGDMSLVGPRPEVPRYVRRYSPEQRAILQLKPGITDLASLCFRDEEALLANADNLEEFYLQHCVPRKIQLNQQYAAGANLWSDTWIILQTVCPYWAGVLLCYGMILTASFWASLELAFNFDLPNLSLSQLGRDLGVVIALQLACLMWHRQCRGLLSYFSVLELRQVAVALGIAGLGLAVWSVTGEGTPALNFVFINTLISLCLLAGFRLCLRRWRERLTLAEEIEVTAEPPARVGIIGAGSTGARLALDLSDCRNSRRTVVAFFDDDFHKWQKNIHDVPVAGMPECLLDGWKQKLDEVFIAMPDTETKRIGEIEQMLRNIRLKFHRVSNHARVSNLPLA